MPDLQTQRLGNEAKGAILGMLCAVSTAGFLLCFREAASLAGRTSVVFAMLLGAALFNSMLAAFRLRVTPRPNRRWLQSALVLSALTVLGNVALATALPLLGAGVSSTLMQTQVFFVAFFAWIFLREEIRLLLLLGALLAASGFAFFAWPGQGAQSLSAYGLLAAMFTSLCFAAMIVWTRFVIHGLDPISLNAGRLWVAVGAMALWPGVLSSAIAMPALAWGLAFGAALGGPVIGRLAIMYSLRFISAAKTKLWGMLSPVVAFFLVYVVYGSLPSTREVLGGLLIVSGVLLPTLWSMRRGSVATQ